MNSSVWTVWLIWSLFSGLFRSFNTKNNHAPILWTVHASLTEREILNRFFSDTAGSQWISRDNWATIAPICSWYGITCDDPTADQGVTALQMPSNNVARKITPELYQMPHLRILNLKGNPIEDANFGGLGMVSENTADRGSPSPVELLDFTECLLKQASGLRFAAPTLLELRLTKNQLSFFPSDIYTLTNLQKLYINYNPMKGVLSTEIGNLRNLQEFYAYSNQLTGRLPTEIGLLDKATVFTLADNHLTGTIPTEVNNMLNLQVFSLHGGTGSDEDLNGAPIPLSNRTGMTGPIPSFALAYRLAKLFLADNAFTGSLPEDFLAHNELRDEFVLVNLRNNKLEGGIPAVLRRFSSLNIDLVGNQLTVDIPDYMCTRSQWMNGLVASYGCDAILCHAGSYNARGQQTSDDSPCLPCPPEAPGSGEVTFMLGATSCPTGPTGQIEVGGGTSTDGGGLPSVDPARVLMNLYLQTDGQRWEQNSGWDILDMFLSASIDLNQVPLEDVDYCRFYGVFCDNQRNVQILSLSNNRLRGTIPPDLFRLPRLLSVDLSFNRIDLDFSVPASQGGGLAVLRYATDLERLKLSHTSVTRVDGISQGAPSLTRLYLDGTDLEEPLPDEIYALTSLDTLHLEAAYVTGFLSSSIGNLSNLKRLNLNENQIEGALPTELGLLTALEYLDLSDNDFSGVLPAELGDMTSLWSIRINGARGGLGGPLLPFDRLPNLRELELAYNVLTGNIPSNFLAGTNPDNDLTVSLTGNSLSGGLPVSLEIFNDLILKVEDNEIDDIPPELCSKAGWMEGEVGLTPDGCDAILCPRFTWSPHGKASPTLNLVCQDCPGNAYFGETVCETGDAHKSRETEILDELFQATGGRYWNLTHTNWTKPGIPICQREGVVCSGTNDPNTGVTELRLSNYGLRGTVPSSIYELPTLRRLALSWNPIELNFTGIGDARMLEVIQLSGTKIDSIAGIEGASDILYEVHIADTGLEGTFPSELLQARTIRALFMSNNRITGPIPPEISQLNLDRLQLDGNEFTGAIPSEIGLLTRMTALLLQNNKLMGLIPAELGNLSNLQEIDLSSQRGELKITGPLFPFKNNPALAKINFSGNYLAGLLPKDLLQTVDKSLPIEVDLSNNILAGGIPSEYDSFQALTINLANNMISEIPAELCDNLGWMGGAPSGTASCDFIMCPPRSHSATGRAVVGQSCQACPYAGQAPFYGSTECDIAPMDGERDVLIEFFRATGGDDWVYKENWNTVLNVCTWYGVICTEDFSVSELRLENNGLENENGDTDIIGLLGRLTKLRVIDLKGNDLILQLDGIPMDSALESLRLSSTGLLSLEGIGQAQNLNSLHAVDCALTGTIPDEVFGLESLSELYLSFNFFNGTLSPLIGGMQKLEQLVLYGNYLSGTIPSQISQLSGLRELVLGKNMFWGPIPSGISSLENLEQVSMQDQQGWELLEGPLPDFASARNLWYIDLSHNDLTGPIPSTFLSGSAVFNSSIMILLRENELTGSPPASLLKFDDVFIDLAGNRIDGIPPDFCVRKEWMYGAVGEVGSCNAILCAKGYYSESGREDSKDEPCRPCPGGGSEFLGQTMCQVFESERLILEHFYAEVGGDRWTSAVSWASSDPICSWEGVRCVGDQQDDEGVEKLDLAFNGLAGTVPSDVWSLPQLKEVNFRGNDELYVQFSGMSMETSVVEILDLSNTRVANLNGLDEARQLRELYVDETGIGGTFPLELFELHKTLEKLHLSWNLLIGTIPSAIDRLSFLTEFHVAGNDFHGTLPASIGYMENLEKIRLDETLISGVLPAKELSYLPRLQSFSASRDAKSGRKIVGNLPAFDKVPSLDSLFLNGQELSGSIPQNFLSSSVDIREVVITDNELTGAVPLQLDSLENVNLELAGNRISDLPKQFCDNGSWMRGNVAKFNDSCDAILCAPGSYNRYGRSIDEDTQCTPCDNTNIALAPYFGSTTCEAPKDQRSILTELFNACQGRQWYRNDYWTSNADVCDWYGVGCDNGQVVLLNLDSNNLKGRIPSSVFRLPKLQVLWLNSNRVTLDFSNIYQATNLLDLRLDSTGLHSIDGIGQARSLTALSLAFNGIRGRFPAEIFQLQNLRYLVMNSNVMTGLLPNVFGNLRYLRYLKLDRNIFVGPIPSFQDSPSLTHLYLGANELSGTIPNSLLGGVASTAAVRIDLSRNRLEGTIPDSLARFEDLRLLDLTQNEITAIPELLCSKKDLNDGAVGKYGCDAILCPAGTVNSVGRRQDELPCKSCRENDPDQLGQAVCGDTTSGSLAIKVAFSFISAMACLFEIM